MQICFLFPITGVSAIELKNGAEIFESSCVGCHNGGGNVLNSRKTLTKASLTENRVYSKQNMYNIIKNGSGQMPAFGEFISPKGNLIPAKLTDSEISSLTDYVIDQAETDWPVSKSSTKKSKNCDVYPGC